MGVTTSNFENCCPSCTAMMAIRVGRLTKDRAEALDCPSASVEQFVGQELLMCWHCGNVAPRSAWDKVDTYDEWRLVFSSGVLANSRKETQERIAQRLRARARELEREADALIGVADEDYSALDQNAGPRLSKS